MSPNTMDNMEKDGLMAGLCFKRYGQTLRDAVEKGTLKAGDIECILEQIEKGIQHIHGLGLVHNDINPANILLDADNATPIIIDFNSCYKKGTSMDYNDGTFPWSNDARIAEFENDDFVLDKVREWMKETLVEKTCPQGIHDREHTL
ncbi:hypothetical protein ARMSODRAFT_1054458 [Armillaria solidipes]|uniref:Protein kinase domain-containing protein n=1 Tax=Armillaria solidipes TaxID=1076256 RepID=A0A2H3B066_9AGAR|nr:hypothetical protein ARMSODRAFT_1054458 [Armillaria solidipes]